MSIDDTSALKVAVLWGGWADEREVSHASATACTEALGQAGFTTVEMLDVADPDFIERLHQGSFDVAFVAMHGAYGEDGCIQGLLEILHIPYTFSGVLASALAADKDISKIMYQHAGIPTPQGIQVTKGQKVDAAAVVEQLGLPLFVKPAVNGSSYGISKVYSASELEPALEHAFESCKSALIETCIVGTEITVPVIGNSNPEALEIVEIVTGADFYDSTAKYEASELHHVMPARLAPEVYAKAQELAVAAHKALGCRGASRSDFIVTAEGIPVILETNTIPGMTAQSLLPDSAAHSGISFPELCRRFIMWALES